MKYSNYSEYDYMKYSNISITPFKILDKTSIDNIFLFLEEKLGDKKDVKYNRKNKGNETENTDTRVGGILGRAFRKDRGDTAGGSNDISDGQRR